MNGEEIDRLTFRRRFHFCPIAPAVLGMEQSPGSHGENAGAAYGQGLNLEIRKSLIDRSPGSPGIPGAKDAPAWEDFGYRAHVFAGDRSGEEGGVPYPTTS